MAQTTVGQLADFGQSVWIDDISRSMIKSGSLKQMIDLGLRGMTSNPTIFEKAISGTPDYDDEIVNLCNGGRTTFEIYDELTTKDVRDAADVFFPVYEASRRLDGYVSLEINPKLAYDAQATIDEGKRLFAKVARSNVMFKVPATAEGFIAVEELTAEGININITLIFSLQQYIDTCDAYLRGIKRLLVKNGDVPRVHSVASVFVSRVDTLVDDLLTRAGIAALKGKAAVANAGLIYRKYREIFSSIKTMKLMEKGVNRQRVLWGSTSTKNPAYSDIKYVTELIAKDTVNTMPEKTFNAFLDHGMVREALGEDASAYRRIIDDLKAARIDIDDICSRLLKDGLEIFEKSFDSLAASLDNKRNLLCAVK